ncbi:MAG: putative Fe-S cluster assembly protein SufT [Deltaproteobacteria bacterium]|nr:MAG: putative Fe-S cluster assembly protein SufT [Deltaproteobacteria bacterium]
MAGEEVIFNREAEVIQIPDGNTLVIPIGTGGYVMQLLGGNFTVRLDTGHLIRIRGEDADAIGLEIPDEAKRDAISAEDFDVERVWDELRTCYDPEIPVNIVDLGLIYGCEVIDLPRGKRVDITMTLTAPGCGMGQVLKDDIEYKVMRIPGVFDAHVEVVFDPPWTPDKMTEEAQLELGFF